MSLISLAKDDTEHRVPEPWRTKFRQIAEAFAAGDFQLNDHSIEGLAPIDLASADFFRDSSRAYGDDLASLDDATWERSVYCWIDGHWEFLVDLTTEHEPVSDLALHARLEERTGLLILDSVHVP
ncbi:DUF7668 domain-containing protein [Qipengyuania atrilutea]|uniref:DUF7668 domain-containing protein n=1 Tax=Qipengyuania atrilutea TaxID=2744473 RepID=A0A850H9D6_9SPHN|nr:hypothetical protein [Actirhodobacter atriluteus]NVD45915.1 hypothetical protein [Actirhodobacter atriluteus]